MNLPNKITLTRIILIPFFIFFYLAEFIPYTKFIALGIFILAALTDKLDGMIARKYNIVTDLGKLLDTSADKMLTMSCLLVVITDGTVPAIYGIIAGMLIIGRDIFVMALKGIAASKGPVKDADQFGRIKFTVMIVALVMLLLVSCDFAYGLFGSFSDIFAYISYGLLMLASLLSLLSCINYIIKYKQFLKE